MKESSNVVASQEMIVMMDSVLAITILVAEGLSARLLWCKGSPSDQQTAY